MDKKIKKNNDTTLLEHILLGLIPFTEENTALVFKPQKFFYELEKKLSNTSFETIKNTFYRAKKQGYLQSVENQNLIITNKGKVKLFKHIKKKNTEKWDGFFRILFFDVPEKERRKRDLLRGRLAELGFVQYQLSAWVCPYDRTEEIDLLILEYKLEPYVHYLLAKTISGEDRLRMIFKLKEVNKYSRS
ncbi:hypothetical protein COY62_02625 [bacterium (Candidatus Howlettbacteria) CG_4_10_14_0_8_um_filter_40_9]|nr:MAG: hypothetical protein COY62_02625 [bacterium (Candidatus Howlettbacteria) CG_4_10_14_0_8_um_filter_40_9]